MSGIGVASFLATTIAFAGGALDFWSFIVVGVVISMCVGSVIMAQWSNGHGTLEINDRGIEFQSLSSEMHLPWKDIANINRGRLPEGTFFERILSGGNPDYIEIVCLKRPRIGFLRGDVSTDNFGVPGLVSRVVRCHLRDPDGFVRAAEPFLRSGVSVPD